jgi:hypothetical protein
MKEHALGYAARGWWIFPVYEIADGRCACKEGAACARAGKHPRTRGGLKDATTEPATITDWWDRWPNANIGIATGRQSNLTVIDIDVADGKPGLVNITALAAKHGGMPATYRVKTGGKGEHYYFRYCEALKTGANVLAEAVDVRSESGYVVAPPSFHISGSRYEVSMQADEPATVPEWMLNTKSSSVPARRKRRSSPQQLTEEQVAELLDYIDPDDRDRWRGVGIILGRISNQRDEFYQLYEAWSAKSAKFDEDRSGNLSRMREAFFRLSLEKPRGDGPELTVGTLIQWATEGGWAGQLQSTARYEKFWAVRPASKFLYVPSGQLWTAQAVNDALPPRLVGTKDNGEPVYQMPAQWLGQHRGIDSIVFDPALPEIVQDRVAREQGIVEDPGATLYNRYYPPRVQLGDPTASAPFVEHVHRLFPTTAEADHIIAWLAHRVQRPGEKVRHALLIGGPPGVGKDTIFETVVPAIGAWNTHSIAPDDIFKPFNEYAAAVLLRINEVVDLHDISRFKFYEATKTLIAGNPEYIAVNPKYGVKFHVRNCCGVVMTTNYGSTGMYLTADDRRHFAVETIELWGEPEQREDYFKRFYAWLFEGDGFAHAAAFLHSVDLATFNPNAPPPKTNTFRKIAASSASGDGWLIDALESLDRPTMVRADRLREALNDALSKNEIARSIGPAMARQGYEIFPNAQRSDGRHNFEVTGTDGKTKRIQAVVYVKRGTPAEELGPLLAKLQAPEGF